MEVVKDRYRRLDELVRRITHEENVRQEGRVLDVLVAEGEGRRDGVTARISGRAQDNRLVHVALPEHLAADDDDGGAPRPGDMVTVRVTHGAPHHLIADSARCGRVLSAEEAAANEALSAGDRIWYDDGPALFEVRRTRAGDAWQRRQQESCAVPEPDAAPVRLGLPTIRVGAPDMGGRSTLGQPRTL